MEQLRLEALYLGLRTKKGVYLKHSRTGKTTPFPLPEARSKDRAFFIFKGGQIPLFAKREMIII
jgi:hypothetical protein